METELQNAVVQASTRPEVRAAVEEVYATLAAGIDARKPICVSSGRCCHFEEFGHRLYVTTMELAKFVHDDPLAQLAASVKPRGLPVLPTTSTWNGQGCPFQIDGLCGVHTIRPFGCRIFFCDATSTAWQHEQYELLHGRLRKLHDELDVPYHYVEWRFALRTLHLTRR